MMMTPLNFKGVNTTLGAPGDWDSASMGECLPLPIMRDGGIMKSLWKPSLRDRFWILMGKPISLEIWSSGHPPVAIEVAKGIKRSDILYKLPD